MSDEQPIDVDRLRPAAGQVWNPERGGMWRTIVAVHPAGVEWTASPDLQAFERWETWDKWVRDMRASCRWT